VKFTNVFNKRKQKVFSWIIVFLWASLIFILSSIPELKTGLGFWDLILRKAAHIFEFAILTLLLWRAFENYKIKSWNGLTYSGALAFVYAIFDEIHQSLVLAREGKLTDILIDSCGIITALAICYFRHKKEKND
jgi:VanZ family protein